MQPSELVTETAMRLREELRKHDLWATEAVALAVVEAVALDFYERGLREAAELVKGHDYTFGAANDAAAKIIDRFRTGTDKDAAPTCDVAEFALQDASGHIAVAILSKLRAPT